MQSKNILQSKVFWLNAISIASTFYPPVGAVVAAYPQGAVGILTGLNVLLRFFTNGKVTLN